LQDLLARDLASLIHPLHDRRDQSGALVLEAAVVTISRSQINHALLTTAEL
jgi:hypothetical protein